MFLVLKRATFGFEYGLVSGHAPRCAVPKIVDALPFHLWCNADRKRHERT